MSHFIRVTGEASLHSNLAWLLAENRVPLYARRVAVHVDFGTLMAGLVKATVTADDIWRRVLRWALAAVNFVRLLLPLDCLVTLSVVIWRLAGLNVASAGRRNVAAFCLIWYIYFSLRSVVTMWYTLKSLFPAWRVLFGVRVPVALSINDLIYCLISVSSWMALLRFLSDISSGPDTTTALAPDKQVLVQRPEIVWDAVEEFGGWEVSDHGKTGDNKVESQSKPHVDFDEEVAEAELAKRSEACHAEDGDVKRKGGTLARLWPMCRASVR